MGDPLSVLVNGLPAFAGLLLVLLVWCLVLWCAFAFVARCSLGACFCFLRDESVAGGGPAAARFYIEGRITSDD
jgi:hypothetical protein